MFGFLNVDKPAGVTSRDVVNRVQRLVKPHKVGHCGTLDPLATGVLVIAIGPATRLVEFVQRMPKTYRGTFLLGRKSKTEDIDGEVMELPMAPVPTGNDICDVSVNFIGRIQQIPPAYSAVKVSGQRSYRLARHGHEVELSPRTVEVHSIFLVRYEYPELELHIRCGSGTYVRALGRDLARALRTEAVMSALRRDAIGPFVVTDAVQADELTPEKILSGLLPPILAVGDMPRITVGSDDQRRLSRGQSIRDASGVSTDEAAAISDSGKLLAILAHDTRGDWIPAKNFVAAR